MAVHVKNHKTSAFICESCNKCFNNQRIFQSHSKKCFSATHTGQDPRPTPKRPRTASNSQHTTIDSVLESVSQSFENSFSDQRMPQANRYFINDDSIYDEELNRPDASSVASHTESGSSQRPAEEGPSQDALDLEQSVASIRTKECKFCHVTFPDNRAYKKHRTLDCIVLECPYCLINFKKEEGAEYRKHVNTHRHLDYPYICPKCNFTTNRMRLFEDHVSTHTGVLRFWCQECEFQTRVSVELQNHLVEVHPEANPEIHT